MINTLLAQPPERIRLAEQRVVVHGLNWQRFEQIVQALGETRTVRLIYDQGTLEITMPTEEHESSVRLIERLIWILVVELGHKLKTMGSTTLSYPQLDRSAEPDNGYYIQNQAKVAGRKVDLTQDPPPDLVVEVDITHTDINKLRFYASLGIPEFWRYNGRELRFYHWVGQCYQEVVCSPTFPLIEKEVIYEFLAQSQQDEVEAERWLRLKIRQLLDPA